MIEPSSIGRAGRTGDTVGAYLSNDIPPQDLGPLGQCLLEALDHAGIGVTVIVDKQGELERVFLNDAGAKALGYSLAEASEMPPLLAVAPEDRPRLAELHRTGEVPPQIEVAVIAKDGRRIPVEVSMAASAYRGHRATVAFLRDLGPRSKVEKALRESEARFKQLAEAAPDVIVVVDRNRFLYVNPAGVRAMQRKDTADFLSMPPSEFLSPEDFGAMQARMREVQAGAQLQPREYRGRRRDGSTITLEISSSPVEWEGRPAILAYGRDVTERVQLQSQMVERDRLAAVGTLAAGIAHEVNNPLTYLMLHLEHLHLMLSQRLGAEAGPALEHVAEAMDGAERVSAIVRDLLELARPRGPRREPTAIAQVCEAAVRLVRPTLDGAASIALSLEPMPLVSTDAARLTQVLVNLLVNAAECGEDDRRINVELRVFLEKDHAVIEVLDDGPGIPDALLPSLFLPFVTTKAPRRGPGGRARHGGLGLGLSICHSIITSLDGTIRGGNRLPRGAVFRIELPTEGDSGVAP